ncbi:MAG: DUF2062 domain-containing protein [Burkholderiales bacterium]|nr:DUF2062 domain-containing protein [Burkholderiales bacterium]
MPKKFFKRYLPSHSSIVENRFLAKFGSLLTHHNLWHLHRRSVAGGVAIGLFTGLIPGPLQILCGAGLAILFRVNLPAMVLGTFWTNPLTIVPIYIVAYNIGSVALGRGTVADVPQPQPLEHQGWLDMLPALWTWFSGMGKPLALGLFMLGIVMAIAGYFAVRGAWRVYVVVAWRRRARSRHAAD